MQAITFFEIARWCVHLAIATCIVIGLSRFSLLNADQRLLFYLVLITAAVEVAALWLWNIHQNNNFIFHFYSVAEFVLIATLYSRHVGGLIRPFYMTCAMMVFAIFAVCNTLFFQNLTQFNSHVAFVEGLLLIALALCYFYKMLHALEYRDLERNPMFWINVSVITYFSGALVLFHIANDMIPEPLKVRGAVWGTHALFNIVHYILYGVALWVTPGKRIAAP